MQSGFDVYMRLVLLSLNLWTTRIVFGILFLELHAKNPAIHGQNN